MKSVPQNSEKIIDLELSFTTSYVLFDNNIISCNEMTVLLNRVFIQFAPSILWNLLEFKRIICYTSWIEFVQKQVLPPIKYN